MGSLKIKNRYRGFPTSVFWLPAVVVLHACGGGGGGDSGGAPGTGGGGTSPVNYSVTTNLNVGGSITPTNQTVPAGSSTSFTISTNANRFISDVTGCSGTLNGSIYTTGPVNQNCTVNVTFADLYNPVAALYPVNGKNWNDYLKKDASNRFAASDTAADGTEINGYRGIIHGGELRQVVVTGRDNCVGLTARDDLGAFDWVCVDNQIPVRMISHGLKTGKHLSDLIDFNLVAWKPNRVIVSDQNTVIGATTQTVWWSNPVNVDNDGSNGSDLTSGEIRIVTANPQATYAITNHKIALVGNPAVTLTNTTITVSSVRYAWVEAKMDIPTDRYGVTLNGTSFSMVRNVNTINGYNAIGMNSGSGNVVMDITVNNAYSAVNIAYSRLNLVKQVNAANVYSGVEIFHSSDNIVQDVTVGKCYDGVQLYSRPVGKIETYRNVVSNVRSSDCYESVHAYYAVDNIIENITTTNNYNGVHIYNGANNIVSNATFEKSFNGVHVYALSTDVKAIGNRFANIVAGKNNQGLYLYQAQNTYLTNIAMSGNLVGLSFYNSSYNALSGVLRMGQNNGDCQVSSGVDPGIAVVNGTCTPQGASNFTTVTGISLANSFVGKILVDDAVNASDTDGNAAYPADVTSFDWTHFENSYRTWADDADGYAGFEWTSGAGRIWDWSVRSSDTVIRNINPVPTGNDTVTHTWSNSLTVTYLKNAVEISGDDIGNDNMLCEADETCLYTPNIGSYQGHGSLVTIASINSGTLQGITLKQYQINGR